MRQSRHTSAVRIVSEETFFGIDSDKYAKFRSAPAARRRKVLILSRLSVKTLLAILGAVSLALGIAGIFLPLLPTTPFLLLTAALWVRGSPRLYAWLLAHPKLGPYIRNFRENRAIPLRSKLLSLVLLWATMLGCVFFVVDSSRWAQAGLIVLAAGITWHILSYRTAK